MNVAHVRAKRRLPAAADGPTSADGHIATCIRCQAEVTRYRSVARNLAALRREVTAAPAGTTQNVLARLARPPRGQRRRRTIEAAAATGAVVAVAGALAVAGWRRRQAA